MSNSFYIIGRTGETALLVSEKKFNYTYNWDVLIKKKKKKSNFNSISQFLYMIKKCCCGNWNKCVSTTLWA